MRDNTFAYFCNQAGRIIPAPDTRMSPVQCGLDPANWKRCEAVGAREIEKVSLIISRQLWEEKRNREVGKKLREMQFLRQMEIKAKLQRLKNFSPKDVHVNEQLERDWKRKQNGLITLIESEFIPERRNTALDVEIHEQSTSPSAGIFQKRAGVA